MKTSLNDLNAYLFDTLDRISDDTLEDEQLEKELKRTDAIVNVSKMIIENGALALKVKAHMDEYGAGENYKLGLLEEK